MIATAPAVSLDALTSIDSIEALAPEWSQLWERCPDATPFQSPNWLLPWLRNLYKGGEIWFLTLRHEERLAGIAPWFIHRHWRNPDVRQISFLGAGISDYLDLLIEPALAETGATAFLEHLMARRASWDIGDFQELRATSPLRARAVPSGLKSFELACGICPVLSLPGSMAELRNGLPSKFRTDLRRAGNRARSGGVVFESATAATLPEYVDALFRLHAARWEPRNEPGVLCQEDIRAFHRQVARRFERSGHLRVHGLRYQGAIAAVVYSFVAGRTAYAYIGGFDPALARLSPGSILMEFSIEHALLEGLRDYDFLRKQEAYKYLWGAADRATSRLLIWHSGSMLPTSAFPEDETYEHD